MPWMTLTQAAVATGVSVRTIYRRIEAEEIETRRQGRNTLVNIEATELAASQSALGQMDISRYNVGSDGDADTIPQALIAGVVHDPAQPEATPPNDEDGGYWSRQSFEAIRDDLRRTRRSAQRAWVACTLLLAAVGAAGYWIHQSTLNYANEMYAHLDRHKTQFDNLQTTTQEKIQTLTNRIAERSGEATVLTGELGKSQQALAALNSTHTETIGELTAKSTLLEVANSERDRVNKAYGLLRDAANQQQASLNQFKGEISQLSQSRAHLTAMATSLQDQLNSQASQAGQLEGSLAEVQRIEDKLRAELADAYNTIAHTKTDNGVLTGKLTAVEASKASLASGIVELRDLLERERAARQTIQQQLEVAMTHLTHVTADRDRLNATVPAATPEEADSITNDISASPEETTEAESPEPTTLNQPSALESTPTTQPADGDA